MRARYSRTGIRWLSRLRLARFPRRAPLAFPFLSSTDLRRRSRARDSLIRRGHPAQIPLRAAPARLVPRRRAIIPIKLHAIEAELQFIQRLIRSVMRGLSMIFRRAIPVSRPLTCMIIFA